MLGGMQYWPLRLTHLIDHAVREHGAREIVSCAIDGRTSRTNWAGIASDARRLASALDQLGIQPGDRVATLAMNHARHLVSWFGAIGMGGIIHTVNWRLFDEQIAFIINDAADRVLLYDAALSETVARVKPRLPTVEHFICFDDDFDVLIAGGDKGFPWVAGDERDPAMLCYTSGTTGNPKGVLYQHRSAALHSMMVVQPDIAELGQRSVVLPVVPLFHAASWGLPFAAAQVGAKMVLSAAADPATLHRLLLEEGVTHAAGVPSVWNSMFQHVESIGSDFGRLRVVLMGGSAASRSLVRRFHAADIRLCHLWGMTETSPVCTSNAYPAGWSAMDAEARIDHVIRQGKAVFGTELRVVDETGVACPRDGQSAGRLEVRGAWVIDTYYGANAPAVDGGGWFDTGDIAVIHPDGVMQITDRAKDVIKSGGEWISSIELENTATGCPGVLEAAAVGIPHPKWEERPLLLAVRCPGSAVTSAEILAHLSGRVAKWWLPDEILFVDELPHTATGKLLKTALRRQYANYRMRDA